MGSKGDGGRGEESRKQRVTRCSIKRCMHSMSKIEGERERERDNGKGSGAKSHI